MEDSSENVFIEEVYSMTRQESYKEIESLLEGASAEHLSALLYHACLQSDLPVNVFTMIMAAQNGLVTQFRQPGLELTPIHIATVHVDRPDIFQTILQASPLSMIQLRDPNEQLRPIDILTHKILMLEEFKRYSKSSSDLELVHRWECARLLVLAHGSIPLSSTLPTVHACLKANDIPLALIERALRRYRDQLTTSDEQGNLPLHLVASQLPPEDMDDLLAEILNKAPCGVKHRNNLGQTPLDLAIACGRRWNSGCQLLLEAYPEALACRNLSRSQYQYILTRMTLRNCTTVVYCMLQGNPELITTTTPNSD